MNNSVSNMKAGIEAQGVCVVDLEEIGRATSTRSKILTSGPRVSSSDDSFTRNELMAIAMNNSNTNG